jgi:hypothetical protein
MTFGVKVGEKEQQMESDRTGLEDYWRLRDAVRAVVDRWRMEYRPCAAYASVKVQEMVDEVQAALDRALPTSAPSPGQPGVNAHGQRLLAMWGSLRHEADIDHGKGCPGRVGNPGCRCGLREFDDVLRELAKPPLAERRAAEREAWDTLLGLPDAPGGPERPPAKPQAATGGQGQATAPPAPAAPPGGPGTAEPGLVVAASPQRENAE